VIVRRELPGDRAAIFAVHAAAFARPGVDVAPEAHLVDWLRGDGDLLPELSLVAVVNGTIVGHVACSRAHIGEQVSLGLGPLGVLVGHQRRGVGSALMHAALGAAGALGEPAVCLLGDPGDYRRFGFELATSVGVDPPNPEWAPHFQIRRLTVWSSMTAGTFHYASAFDRI